MKRDELASYLDRLLDVSRVKDYCPNGLQVEGRSEVRRIVTGVTASLAFVEAAADADADALLVHHGWFWRGEDGRIVGARRRRIAALLDADASLFAYHLPLDLHPELGNNAQLAARLGLVADGRCGEQDLVWVGMLPAAETIDAFRARVETAVGRHPLVIGDRERVVRRIAWCTGGAQGYFEAAIAAGVDAYVTGEISEQHVHLARETGVAFVAAGHHATERYGVQALGRHLAATFGLDHRFIDVDSPV
jgi:dinuclear metal center YbgI/SA1388 family protein